MNEAVSAGAILLGCEIGAGYCVYGLASFLYYSIYPPVRYLRLPPCLRNPCLSSRSVACALVCQSLPRACVLQLLYITFLAEFFSDDEGLDMDMMYYSEMKDAGYFDESHEEF